MKVNFLFLALFAPVSLYSIQFLTDLGHQAQTAHTAIEQLSQKASQEQQKELATHLSALKNAQQQLAVAKKLVDKQELSTEESMIMLQKQKTYISALSKLSKQDSSTFLNNARSALQEIQPQAKL